MNATYFRVDRDLVGLGVLAGDLIELDMTKDHPAILVRVIALSDVLRLRGTAELRSIGDGGDAVAPKLTVLK